jgi:hypothetical protein
MARNQDMAKDIIATNGTAKPAVLPPMREQRAGRIGSDDAAVAVAMAAERIAARKERNAQRSSESRAMVLLQGIATEEHRRMNGARYGMTAEDVASAAFLRLSEHDAPTLAAIGADGIVDKEMRDASARCRMVCRSVLSNEAAKMTTELLPERIADRRSGGNEVKRQAVLASLDNDGRVSKADRDDQRSFAIGTAEMRGDLTGRESVQADRPRQAGSAAAWQAARDNAAAETVRKAVKAEQHRMPYIAEQTTNMPPSNMPQKEGSVRQLREQSLEAMLSDVMRPHSDRMVNHDIATDRIWGGNFRRTLTNALAAEHIGGRKGSARLSLMHAVKRAESDQNWQRRHEAWISAHVRAAEHTVSERKAFSEECKAGEPMHSFRTVDGDFRAATNGEKKAARQALLSAEQELSRWRTIQGIWQAAIVGRFTLASALFAALAVETDRSYNESTVVDWQSLALAIGADATDTGLKALRDFVRTAVSDMAVTGAADRQRFARIAAERAESIGEAQRQADVRQAVATFAAGIAAVLDRQRAAERQAVADDIASARAAFRQMTAARCGQRLLPLLPSAQLPAVAAGQ